MTRRSIRTEVEYEAALARAADLMSSPVGTPAADELDALATVIERYEDEAVPFLPPGSADVAVPAEAHVVRPGA